MWDTFYFFDRINRIYRIEEDREERLTGTVRPTSAGKVLFQVGMSVPAHPLMRLNFWWGMAIEDG